jgi:hypothetical protein
MGILRGSPHGVCGAKSFWKRTLVKSKNINADFDKTHDFSSFSGGLRGVLRFRKSAVKLIPVRGENKFRAGHKIKCGYVMGLGAQI